VGAPKHRRLPAPVASGAHWQASARREARPSPPAAVAASAAKARRWVQAREPDNLGREEERQGARIGGVRLCWRCYLRGPPAGDHTLSCRGSAT